MVQRTKKRTREKLLKSTREDLSQSLLCCIFAPDKIIAPSGSLFPLSTWPFFYARNNKIYLFSILYTFPQCPDAWESLQSPSTRSWDHAKCWRKAHSVERTHFLEFASTTEQLVHSMIANLLPALGDSWTVRGCGGTLRVYLWDKVWSAILLLDLFEE